MKKYRVVAVICIFCLFVLTSCEQKISVRFPSEQNWSIQTAADFDSDVVEDVGSIAGSIIGDEFGFDFPGSIFDPKLMLPPIMRLLEQTFESYGMDFIWSYSNDKLVYKVSGYSYSQLTNMVPPEYFSITPLGDNTYHLVIDYSYLGEEYMMATNMIYSTELTVSAGKIIDSNADKQTTTKATWYNPSRVDVTYKPGSPVAAIVGVILGIAGLGLLIWIISKIAKGGGGRMTCPSCGAKVGRGSSDCPNCGGWLGDLNSPPSDTQYPDNYY